MPVKPGKMNHPATKATISHVVMGSRRKIQISLGITDIPARPAAFPARLTIFDLFDAYLAV
jgi:hypothetical protein